jgi:MFS family permease
LNLTAAERRIVFLIGAVNFINVLDFMIVLPLGPDFARALAIAPSHVGFIGGAYSAAACVAGLAASLFLDRFDRRRALAACMAGLVVGTALGGLFRGCAGLTPPKGSGLYATHPHPVPLPLRGRGGAGKASHLLVPSTAKRERVRVRVRRRPRSSAV